MNTLYTSGRENFLDGQISWTTHTIRAVLVDTTQYTPNFDTNRWLTDIPAEAKIATSGPLSGKSADDGVAVANDVAFNSVTGPTAQAVVLYRDTGVTSTSQLIAYIDQGVNLPVTPDGGTITVRWDTGENKIFTL